MKKLICLLLAFMMTAAFACAKPEEKKAETRSEGFAIKTASLDEYPAFPNYGDVDDTEYFRLLDIWEAAQRERRSAGKNVKEGLTFPIGLFDSLYEKDKNLVCSPVSVYLALAMLAETADGDTRAEIISALGAKDIDEVCSMAKAIIESEMFDDGAAACLLADSIWMNDRVEYHEDTLARLAEYYFADSFSGDMADPAYTEALRAWINERTKDLLKDSVEGLEFEPLTVLALVSTVYFKAAWENEFNKDATDEGVFHTPSGDVNCDMMHNTEMMEYFRGTNFTAVKKPLESGGYMWFLLPDEGVSLDELSSVLNGSLTGFASKTVEFTMPKLDVSTKADLIPVFEKLGIKLAMIPGAADFSPLTDLDEVHVSSAEHAARLKTDEEGVEAAAYTIIMLAEGMAMPDPEVIEFRLDRPFLFMVTGMSSMPLFIGAVNSPMD